MGRIGTELSILLGVAVLMLIPISSSAEAFDDVSYDPGADEIVVTMLYSGTNPDHQFSLRWDECVAHPDSTTDVTAQVVDDQERDEARQEFRKTVRLSLKGLSCRPARVTLRASPKAYTSLQVPAAR